MTKDTSVGVCDVPCYVIVKKITDDPHISLRQLRLGVREIGSELLESVRTTIKEVCDRLDEEAWHGEE